MKVRDIMSQNVVTISSNTSIADAKRIMDAHHIRRLPVVDKGKLAGLVTERGLERVSPSKATSLSVWELSYLLEKTTVKDIMEKSVLTVSPDMDAEEAIAMAQASKVGSLIVIEDNMVAGIVTTNDFFYRIINPLLGIGMPGSRIEVKEAGNGPSMEAILSEINKEGLKVSSIHIEQEGKPANDVCFHVDTSDPGKLLMALKAKGFTAAVRKR
jgi:acetoin utilization protein AcuB